MDKVYVLFEVSANGEKSIRSIFKSKENAKKAADKLTIMHDKVNYQDSDYETSLDEDLYYEVEGFEVQ